MSTTETNGATPFRASDLLLVRRNRLVLGLAASPFLGLLGLVVGAIFINPVFLAFSIHLFILGLVAMAFAWKRNFRPVSTPVNVYADAAGVKIEERFLPRAEIRAGFIMPGTTPKVLLRRKGLRLPVE